MNILRWIAFAAVLMTGAGVWAAGGPNIVYILCDDLGYGDIHCLNPQRGKIATPHVDQFAGQGMVFTDAHSGSSVCTPTRYGIMTGRYSWRSHLQSGVLGGASPPLIAADRFTVPMLLKQQGYATACIGKWHLGMQWATASGKNLKRSEFAEIDFSKPIQRGPTAVGFDYYYGISASLDMPPFTFIENDHVVALPTAMKKWIRQGPAAPDFEAINVLPTLAKKASAYIGDRAADARAGKPFFLYLPLNSPHTPIVPTKEFAGKSGLGDYGDFVMETDWAVGQVLDAIDKSGIADNTLVIFTSDNGCSPAADVTHLESLGHFPSFIFRGYKADIWDGGHHIPFIVRWPAKIKAGSHTDQLICLTDLMATCADLTGQKLPQDAGEDSVSILPALLGTDAKPLHEAVIHHSIQGNFAIRCGQWKLELCPGSGGWGSPRDAEARKQKLPCVQLYDMSSDVSEKVNLQDKHPEIVERLLALLQKYVAEGRSTAGSARQNDVEVDIWKKGDHWPGTKGVKE